MSNFYLPPDVITEILLCLPITSILRYRYVCKLWKTIIENPRFVSMHLKKIKKPHLDKFLLECNTVLSNKSGRIIKTSNNYGFLPLLEPDKSIRNNNAFRTTSNKPESWVPSGHVPVFCSCNGLICQLVEKETKFRIMNPLYLSLFDVIEVEAPYAHDQPQSLAAFGFGFDKSSNRFKIVCLVKKIGLSKSFKLLVHELGGSKTSWRELPQSSLLGGWNISFCSEKSVVFHDGYIYWVPHISKEGASWRCITSFNLSSETLEIIHYLPSYVVDTWLDHFHTRILFDLNGSLGLVVEKLANIEVYVYCKEIQTPQKWSKIFCISKPWEVNDKCHVEWIYHFGGFDIVMKSSLGQYLRYNMQTRITTNLPELQQGISYICHQGSLVRPSDLDVLTI